MAVLCRVNMWDWPANHANQRESKKMGRVGSPSRPKIQARMRRLPQTNSSRKTPRPQERNNDRAGPKICEYVGLTPSRREKKQNHGRQNHLEEGQVGTVFIPPPCLRERFPSCRKSVPIGAICGCLRSSTHHSGACRYLLLAHRDRLGVEFFDFVAC
jgi:hypothetical protein